MNHPVSASKSSPLAGGTLHLAYCTVYAEHCTCTCTCPCTCKLHTTHFTLHTTHQAFILHFANLPLHTANIQNLHELDSRFTWRNVPWLNSGNFEYIKINRYLCHQTERRRKNTYFKKYFCMWHLTSDTWKKVHEVSWSSCLQKNSCYFNST